METIGIKILKDKKELIFEVKDFAHHEGDQCKFEVFSNGDFVAGFEPDRHEYLRVCKNPGILDEETLYLIADKLEALHL